MLVQSFRDTLPKAKQLGHRVVEQFDDIIAQFSGLWNVQHKEDGSHGDITADSIDVLGDLTVHGDIIGGGGTSAVLDNIRLRGTNGNNQGRVQFAAEEDDLSALIQRTTVSSAQCLEVAPNWVPNQSITYHLGLATRVWASLWSVVANIGGISGDAQLSYDIVNGGLAVDDDVLPATTAAYDLGTPGSGPKRWRNLYLSSAVFEDTRTVAMGYPIAQAFSAGNYSGDGAMTWTVASGAVNTNVYTRIGKSILWTVTVLAAGGTSAIGGTPSSQLRITVPGGLTLNTAYLFTNRVAYVTEGGAAIPARVQLATSTSVLIVKDDGSNWAGNITLLFQVQMFEA